MNWIFKLVIFFAIICLVKLLINLNKYLRIKYLLQKYKEYLKNPEWEFSKNKPEILKLFKDAGIQDGGVTVSQHVGYGTLKVQPISVLKNINYRNEDVVNIMMENFYSTIGYYKIRLFETFNPLYWIEIIIFLPKNIFYYIGIKSNHIIIKLFQITYWIIGFFASIKAIFNLNLYEIFIRQF